MEADEDALDAFKEVMATMIFASMVMLAIQSIEEDMAKNAALN